LNKTDFDFDHDDFKQMLARAARGYEIAKKRFFENVAHWQELGADSFGGKFSVDITSGGNGVDGEVLGKKFAIFLSPIVTEKENYAEAVLSVRDLLADENIEVCRFLVAPNGSVFSTVEEQLLSWEHDFHSYKLLISIVRRVLRAPLKD
jgi:hypothetical protein